MPRKASSFNTGELSILNSLAPAKLRGGTRSCRQEGRIFDGIRCLKEDCFHQFAERNTSDYSLASKDMLKLTSGDHTKESSQGNTDFQHLAWSDLIDPAAEIGARPLSNIIRSELIWTERAGHARTTSSIGLGYRHPRTRSCGFARPALQNRTARRVEAIRRQPACS